MKKMTDKILIGKFLFISLMVILISAPVIAICNFESLRYYGTCPYDGDIKVYDTQGNLIVEQLFSIDQGCYEGKYSIQVPGGRENECVLNNEEQVTFKLNDNVVGYDVWQGEDVKEFNLRLNPSVSKPVDVDVTMWASIVALIIVLLVVFKIYKDKQRR